MQKGRVTIAGYDLRTEPEKVRESIGIVFQELTLDRDMTVREILEYHGRLYSMFILENAHYWLSGETIERIKQEQIAEIERRIKALRGGKTLPELAGRTVILIDDGIAMGSTMRAAIELCKNRKAGKIVVAVPVAGREVAEELQKKVDELVVLEIPAYFRAVAQAYERWYDVSDEEVLDLLRESIREKELKDQEFHDRRRGKDIGDQHGRFTQRH